MNLKIKISTPGKGKPFMKQLPGLKPVWGNCTFFINEDIPECDLWVVYGGLDKIEKVFCNKDSTLLITNEPESVKKYNKKFTNQFGAIMTCQKNISHSNLIYSQQSLPWWVGHKLHSDNRDDIEHSKTYDELKSILNTTKTKTLSAIVSNKKFTKGHVERFIFTQKLKQAFGDQIDIFGSGNNTIEDKWDAIAPYKYHIVIENSSYEDYWTEKLSDAFLGQTYPIYYGCTNINKYFNKNSLSIIDINNPSEAISQIKSIINKNTYENSVENINLSKLLILDEYQIFPMLCDYANKHLPKVEKENITLNPEKEYLFKKILKKIMKVILNKFTN